MYTFIYLLSNCRPSKSLSFDATRLRFGSYFYSSQKLHVCSTHLNVRDGNTWWGEEISLEMRPLNGHFRMPTTTNVYNSEVE
jgi:hypothetical protein